jgi:transcriptional regulator with XRE-family HTH domain
MLQPTPSDRPEEPGVEARQQRQIAPAAAPVMDPAWRAGRKLKEAREQQGLSVAEVADRIRVRREFLEALEDMNMKLLPGKAYAVAFLRSYARELGLDEKAIVDQFQAESALTREDIHKPIRNPTSKPSARRPWMAAAALGVAAVAFIGWRAMEAQHPAPAAPPAEAAAAAASGPPSNGARAPAPVNASGAESRLVEIRALSEGWLEARGPDGTVFLSRTLEPGEVYRPDPSPGWTLHARDGGAFEVFINGQSAGLLGIAGMPVLGRQLDEIKPVEQAQLAAPRS